MKKSRLKQEVKSEMLLLKNEPKMVTLSQAIGISLNSLKQAIRRDSEYLTTPAYTDCIKSKFGFKGEITETYTIDESFLSNHG